jgi:hypothetical protein
VEARWRNWGEILQDRGCGTEEAQVIIKAARQDAPTSPIFIQRAWLRNEPVWLVGGAIDTNYHLTGRICPPTLKELDAERRQGTKFWLHAVSTEPPYLLIDQFSEYR